jgi:hypothetical protein
LEFHVQVRAGPAHIQLTERLPGPAHSSAGAGLFDPEVAVEVLSPRVLVEHGGERDTQGFANIEQAARADAILPAFVFLNLLERDAQSLAKFNLAHVQILPTLAHSLSDEFVDCTRASGVTVLPSSPFPVGHHLHPHGRFDRSGSRHR